MGTGGATPRHPEPLLVVAAPSRRGFPGPTSRTRRSPAPRAPRPGGSGGLTTVYDGVVGPGFLPAFAAATGLERVDYVVLLPSVERCVERVATRTGHGFRDEAATRTMHAGFAAAALDERHVVRDPPDGAGAVADLVAAARAGGPLTYAAPG